jgi:hypothetical protein
MTAIPPPPPPSTGGHPPGRCRGAGGAGDAPSPRHPYPRSKDFASATSFRLSRGDDPPRQVRRPDKRGAAARARWAFLLKATGAPRISDRTEPDPNHSGGWGRQTLPAPCRQPVHQPACFAERGDPEDRRTAAPPASPSWPWMGPPLPEVKSAPPRPSALRPPGKWRAPALTRSVASGSSRAPPRRPAAACPSAAATQRSSGLPRQATGRGQ